MSTRSTSLYRNHRFLPEIIAHAVWLYHRFSLSFREVEELLAERGVIVRVLSRIVERERSSHQPHAVPLRHEPSA